jgi:hypothetical protein
MGELGPLHGPDTQLVRLPSAALLGPFAPALTFNRPPIFLMRSSAPGVMLEYSTTTTATRDRLMNSRLGIATLLVLLSACSPTRVVLLKTGVGSPLEHRPSSWKGSVAVDEDDFGAFLALQVLEAPLEVRPHPHGQFVRASYSGNDTAKPWHLMLRKGIGGMCAAGQRTEDCISLLDDVMGLSRDEKLVVALGLSFSPLRESISEAVQDTLAPQLFYSLIATSLVSWVVLAANPEPVFTKSAAFVSALMLIYLGGDTFLDVLKASLELRQASVVATTLEELEEASQRFARVVGPKVARVLVLAVTIVATRGMMGGSAWLASRLPALPHFPEAAALGASQFRLNLASLEQVSSVAVVQGNIVITLAPTAVAMAMGTGGTGPNGRRDTAVTNYRETFFSAHPSLRDKVVVHHAVEQQVLTRYPGLFTEAELHSLSNLRGIPKAINPDLHLSKIRRAWNDFYRAHARPTKQQVLDYAAQLDRQFGAIFEPPL